MYISNKKSGIIGFLAFVFISGTIMANAYSEGADDVIYAENKTLNSTQSGNVLHAGPKTEIPAGMEVVYISGVRYVVPEGAKVSKEYGYNQIEPITLYSARRFKDMEDRIKDLEKRVEKLEAESEENDSKERDKE